MSLRLLWDRLQNSLWFRPTLWVIGLALLALLLTIVDSRIAVENYILDSWTWFFVSGAAGARTMLGSIATGMLTATTVAFSILMVAVVQTANAYSPRILPLYLRDKGNQHVLGILIGTFVYSLVVLRAIHTNGDQEFVPPLATNAGLLLTLFATGAFIYFIHHAVHSISVSNIILLTLNATSRLIENNEIFPETLGLAWPGEKTPSLPESSPALVESKDGGYVQYVDGEKLLKSVTQADALLHLNYTIGQHIYPGSTLAKVWPAGALTGELDRQIQEAVTLAKQRSISNDLLFGIRQLSDIAVRALSPGINDPSTALHCIDALGLIVVRMSRHGPIITYRCDAQRQVRIVADAPIFTELLNAAFSQIRYYGSGDLETILHLLQTYGKIALIATRAEEQAGLWQQALTLLQTADRNIYTPADRSRINEAFISVAEAFGYDAYHYFLDLEAGDASHPIKS